MENKKKINDYDYLHANARVRGMERNLVTVEKLRRMAEASSEKEALKELADCGYGDISSESELNRVIIEKRRELAEEMKAMLPDAGMIDFFLIKYDYHNAKVILKSLAVGGDYKGAILDCGRVKAQDMEAALTAVSTDPEGHLTPAMREAVENAKQMIAKTFDAQVSDTILDRACYKEMLDTAAGTGSDFLTGYARLAIDVLNLRTAVRLRKMGEDCSRIMNFFIEGGDFDISKFNTDITPEYLASVFDNSRLAPVAAAGADAIQNAGSMLALDNAAENALMTYMQQAKYAAFGESPAIAFMAAKEAEFSVVHTVLANRHGGLSPQLIMEGLRNTYA